MLRVSRKTDYGMRAMLELAYAAQSGGLARTADIARRTRAPSKFLEAILGDLRKAGLVDSRRGAAGGHRLAREPARISVGEVWRVLEGRPTREPAPTDGEARALRELWADVERAAARVADGTTLEDMARRARDAAAVPDFAI